MRGECALQRQNTDDTADWNRVYGVDANIRLPGQTDWSTYLVNTSTPGVTGSTAAWRTSINHEGNYFHGKVGVMELGRHFRDDLGYYRRTDARS